LRGTFVVGTDRNGAAAAGPSGAVGAGRAGPRKPAAGASVMIGPLLRLAATTVAGRAVRNVAADATHRLMLSLGAGLAGAAAVFCLSRAAVTLLERHMDPAEAWAVLGGFYGVLGGVSYFAATRRRRG